MPGAQYGVVGAGRGRLVAVVGAILALNLAVFVLWTGRGWVEGGSPAGGPVETPGDLTPGIGSVVEDRWLVDLDLDGFALRARTGDCLAASGTVEQSTDGGATWFPTAMASVVVVHAVDADSEPVPAVVGAARDCRPRYWQTGDRGRIWEASENRPPKWYALPVAEGRPASISTPVADVPSPCPAEVAIVEVQPGAVLCADGLVLRSGDDGVTWTAFARVENASSVVLDGDVGFAAVRGAGCGGVRILRSAPQAWESLACVEGAEPVGAALAVQAGTALLVTYNGTWRSTDGGRSWAVT